ncbi:adenine phosphoribosyltransferase [Podochytrium sp. JEL0797]|nr:adenine phosphoribosyltransferase [Podochytrium sp. JEL0797]
MFPETGLARFILVIGVAAVYNSIQCFVPKMRLTSRIYARKPMEATPLAARQMGLWTFTSAVIRLYCAYNIENAACYQMCMITFAVALFAFVGEVFIHKTAPITSPGVYPALMVSKNLQMSDVAYIKSKLRAIPDFPKKGIVFQDIFGIFQDPLAVEMLVTNILQKLNSSNLGKIDAIVGLDARGFLLGPIIALRLGCAFVPVRKAGKLPGATSQVAYTKEYGTDYFEMHEGAITPGQNVVILDDLIATGGSAKAAGELVKMNGGKTVQYVFFIELSFLKGRDELDAPTYAVMTFDD